MPVLSLFLNIVWVVFGGFWMALAWVVAGILMALTIIGLPWTRAAFANAWYTLLPFGQTVIGSEEYTGRRSLATGPLGVIGNIVWLLLGGWWIALLHLAHAILFAVTIIGIPFAWAHLKLAGLALWPIGRTVVPIEEAERFRYGA
ncbi:MAG: YccF domain-containing protein [Alphaproteobacteria bacterium]|nr:YccF domain-containing protein [Alphaproteobacteria bacterium]